MLAEWRCGCSQSRAGALRGVLTGIPHALSRIILVHVASRLISGMMAAVSQIDLLIRTELLVVRHIHFLMVLLLAMLIIGVIVLLVDGDD